MAATINVNNMTVVHKGSGGVSTAFPDVCKTPSPGGPIPIPYPNISKSSDTSKGSKNVKMDGNPIMLKGSNFRMSTGDEAGSAGGGIISSKIKGKAKYMNYSFDVKVEGKAVPRLKDPMGQNLGSPPQSASPAELQGPMVIVDRDQIAETQEEACEILEGKEVEGKEAARKGGMVRKEKGPDGESFDDFDSIKQVCEDNNVLISFRDTSVDCANKLGKYPSKGCDVAAKTISNKSLAKATQGPGVMGKIKDYDLKGFVGDYGKDGELIGVLTKTEKGNIPVSLSDIPPVPANTYTGDFDMHDMIDASGDVIPGESGMDKMLRQEINDSIGDQDLVKHGAQSQYGDYVLDKSVGDDKIVKDLMQPDPPVTVIDGTQSPPKVYRLETNEDIINMYKCKGTPVPSEWNIKKEKNLTDRIRARKKVN